MGTETSLALMSRASEMLAQATTIQKAKELKDLALTAAELKTNPTPGIYLIFHKIQCIYIGESENMRRRLAEHDLRSWFKIPAVRVLWFMYDSKQARKDTEKRLIKRFRPLLNGKSCAVRIPALYEARGMKLDWARKYLDD